MNEYKISIVGRARTGKSILLTRFVKNPEELIGLSSVGADGTKVPVTLILTEKETELKIKIIFKDEQKNPKIYEMNILPQLHDLLKKKKDIKDQIKYIEIEMEAADWVRDILIKHNLFKLLVTDTEGISGDVKILNAESWKANLFMLVMNSSNKVEFAKSIYEMRKLLIGENIIYCVSKPDDTFSLIESDMENDINDLQNDAQKILSDFQDELRSLSKERSLLTLKQVQRKDEFKRLAIPNIKPIKNQYEKGRKYIDDQLKEFLAFYIANEENPIKLEKGDLEEEQAILYLEKIKSISQNKIQNVNFRDINKNYRKATFLHHLYMQNRLKSHDNGYLTSKHWEFYFSLKQFLYDELEKIVYEEDFPLTEDEQAYLLQTYFSAVVLNTKWIDRLVTTIDSREETTQAAIISILNSRKIVNALEKGVSPDEVLEKELGWSNNLLAVENVLNTPMHYAREIESSDKIEEFFEKVLKKIMLYFIDTSSSNIL